MTWSAWFLSSLLLLLVSAPFFDEVHHGDRIMSLVMCIVLVLSVLAVESSTMRSRPVLIIAGFSILLQLAGAFSSLDIVVRCADAVSLILLMIAAGWLLHSIITAPAVHGDIILNAVSVYLLIGVIWAFVFMAIHQIDPEAYAFELKFADRNLSTYLYLSFMTLTTLGYGDITSINPFAQIWSVLEAITGVFFQAIIVARLVSVYVPKR